MKPLHPTTSVPRRREIEVPANGDDNLVGLPRPHANAAWLLLLWEHRQFLRRWLLRGLAIAVVIAFVIPKRYESTARMMPPDPQSSSGTAMLAALAGGSSSNLLGGSSSSGIPNLGMLAADMLGMKSTDAILIGILKSDTLQDRIIDRFQLQKAYWDRYMQDARKDLTRFTDISEDRKSGIITIVVTDRDPKRAAAIANAYIEELDLLAGQLSTSAARRERVFIEQRLKSVKDQLDTAAQQFSQYASQNTAVDISAQTKAMVESAAVLQGQLIAAQSELEGLQQIYTNNNIRVRTLEARIAELKRQLQNISGNGSSAGPDSSAEEIYPSIRKLPLLGVRWADLYRQNKMAEAVYLMLNQRYELAKIEEAKSIPTIKVLDPGNVPEKKSSPPRLVIIILGTMFVFAAACLWVLGNSAWTDVDPEDARKRLAEEVISKSREQVMRVSKHTKALVRRNGNSNRSKSDPE